MRGEAPERHRKRNAVRRRILYPAVERANALLAERELPTISSDVTFHSLRRTCASLAAEAGVDPARTAAQLGHTDARFTLKVYTDVTNRRENPSERIGSLISGHSGTGATMNGHSNGNGADLESANPALPRLNSAHSGG
jgi:hypothetical protein